MIAPLSKNELRSTKPASDSFAHIQRHPISVVLDNVIHPYNVGSVFRVADALLVEKIYLCGRTPYPPNKKIKSAARGAERWVPWQVEPTANGLITKLKSTGVLIVAAELTAHSVRYDRVNYSRPVVIVLGNEKTGVSNAVLNQADNVVYVPTLGMNNSISVASAASIILYECFRQINL